MAASGSSQTPGLFGDPISALSMGYIGSRILTVAVQLALFTHIAEGAATVEEIARRASASPRGVRMILDAIVGHGLLMKSAGRYSLTPDSNDRLVKTSPNYCVRTMEIDAFWPTWTNLLQAVKSGNPITRVEDQANAERFFSVLVRDLHVSNAQPARAVAAALGVGSGRLGLRVLDIACGSGVWGIAFGIADTEARVTFQDFEGVLKIASENAQAEGLAGRHDTLAGDLKKVDFGESRYDVALLGNIAHSEGEASTRDLLRRLHRAMRPGGRVVVIELIPNDARTQPPFALDFALMMLLHTREGDVYTAAEYSAWLREARFSKVEIVSVSGRSPLIVGVK